MAVPSSVTVPASRPTIPVTVLISVDFAGAVLPQQRVDLAGPQREVHALEGGKPAKLFVSPRIARRGVSLPWPEDMQSIPQV